MTDITARLGKEEDAPSATVSYEFGGDLAASANLFGEDVVHSRFVSAATVDLQALIRRGLSSEEPKSMEEIQAQVDDWKPGVSTRKRKSAKEKAMDAVAALTPEERTALLASLEA